MARGVVGPRGLEHLVGWRGVADEVPGEGAGAKAVPSSISGKLQTLNRFWACAATHPLSFLLLARANGVGAGVEGRIVAWTIDVVRVQSVVHGECAACIFLDISLCFHYVHFLRASRRWRCCSGDHRQHDATCQGKADDARAFQARQITPRTGA